MARKIAPKGRFRKVVRVPGGSTGEAIVELLELVEHDLGQALNDVNDALEAIMVDNDWGWGKEPAYKVHDPRHIADGLRAMHKNLKELRAVANYMEDLAEDTRPIKKKIAKKKATKKKRAKRKR